MFGMESDPIDGEAPDGLDRLIIRNTKPGIS